MTTTEPKKRGRKPKMAAPTTEINNPYNKVNQEGRYLSWENGYHSKSENDCPYDADDSDNRELYKVWKAGFRANPGHKELKVNTEGEAQHAAPVAVKTQANHTDINSMPTELLELELKKRKIGELKQLCQTEQELKVKLEQVQRRIQTMSILVGDVK